MIEEKQLVKAILAELLKSHEHTILLPPKIKEEIPKFIKNFKHYRICDSCSSIICQPVFDFNNLTFLYHWCLKCNRKYEE